MGGCNDPLDELLGEESSGCLSTVPLPPLLRFSPSLGIHAYADTLSIDPHRWRLAPGRAHCGFDPRPRVGFNHQCKAATTARTAGLAAERPRTSRGGDDAVYHRRRDGGQVALAKFPFLAHQSPDFAPTPPLERGADAPRHHSNPFEVAPDAPVAVNVRLEHLPVVNARLPRLPGVTEHQAALELVKIDAQRLAALAAGGEFDGVGAAKRGRVVVLRARGHMDYDGFGVPANMDPLLKAKACAGQPIEGRADGHCHRA